jgi:hypothetical protein
MIDIKELIILRQRNDPAFRVVREARSSRFYRRDQVLLLYPPGKSARETRALVEQFVAEFNRALPADTKTKVRLDDVQILAGGTVLVNGLNADALSKPTTPPPPPPPPPPWYPLDRILNYVRVAIAIQDLGKTVPILTTEFEIRSTSRIA